MSDRWMSMRTLLASPDWFRNWLGYQDNKYNSNPVVGSTQVGSGATPIDRWLVLDGHVLDSVVSWSLVTPDKAFIRTIDLQGAPREYEAGQWIVDFLVRLQTRSARCIKCREAYCVTLGADLGIAELRR